MRPGQRRPGSLPVSHPTLLVLCVGYTVPHGSWLAGSVLPAASGTHPLEFSGHGSCPPVLHARPHTLEAGAWPFCSWSGLEALGLTTVGTSQWCFHVDMMTYLSTWKVKARRLSDPSLPSEVFPSCSPPSPRLPGLSAQGWNVLSRVCFLLTECPPAASPRLLILRKATMEGQDSENGPFVAPWAQRREPVCVCASSVLGSRVGEHGAGCETGIAGVAVVCGFRQSQEGG